ERLCPVGVDIFDRPARLTAHCEPSWRAANAVKAIAYNNGTTTPNGDGAATPGVIPVGDFRVLRCVSLPEIVRVSNTLILAPGNIAGDIAHKGHRRADAHVFGFGAQAKPVAKEMRARQYKLERAETYWDLGTAPSPQRSGNSLSQEQRRKRFHYPAGLWRADFPRYRFSLSTET